MKRLLQSLAACAVGAMLAVPISASAATYDEGGFRWYYNAYETPRGEYPYEARIYDVEQLDASGNVKAWDATSLTIPATLPMPETTNEYARAKFDDNGNPISYETVRGPKVKSGVATVTSVDAGQDYNDVLTSVTIPETVGYVDGFRDCQNLATVTMGADTEFDHWSFARTKWLKDQGDFVIRDGTLIAYQGTATEVNVPAGVKRIGGSAFDSYYNAATKNMTKVTLPAGLEEIGDEAFYECEKLASIDIPDSVRVIEGWAFEYCYALTSVTVPSKVKRLEDYVFNGCDKLASVTLPATLRSIGEGAFCDCVSLASIAIPASVEMIGSRAFIGCTSLASVAIPASVEWIYDRAFYGCTSLASVDIPASVEGIDYSAFEDCTSLATVTGCAGVEWLDNSAFANTALWNVVDDIVLAGSLVLGADGTLPENLTIPEGVTYIAAGVLIGDNTVKTLNLPSTLRVIEEMAFAWSSVETVSGGAGIETASDYAFVSTKYDDTFWDDRGDASKPFELLRLGKVARGYKGVCPAAIVIPDDVTRLSESLFDHDEDTSTDNIASVVIGAGVEQIGRYAFYENSNLKTVTGGASLKDIDGGAFADCKSLESVTLGGKIESLNGGIFSGCGNLQSVVLAGSSVDFAQNQFQDCANLVSVTVNLVDPEDSDDEDDEPMVRVGSGTFATSPKFEGVTVNRPGFKLTGWGDADELDEEFPNEVATFFIYRKSNVFWDDDYHGVAFQSLWKRVLRDTASGTPFNLSVASTYIGWITDADGNLVGSVSVKVTKGKKGATSANATATVTVLGGKKVTLKGTIDANGNGQGALAGLVLTGNGLAGTLAVNSAAYEVDGARDVAKTSKDPDQNVFKTLNKKVWTLVLAPESERDVPSLAKGFAGLSVSMGNKGKAKLSGVLPDGTKLNISAQTVVGDYNCCIPIVYSKAKSTIGFLVWIDRAGAPLAVTAISPWAGRPSGSSAFVTEMELVDFKSLQAISENTSFSVDADALPETLAGVQADYLPVDEPVAVSSRKWTLAKPAVIKYKKGVFDQAAYEKGVAGGKTNLSALKLKYTAKSGLFSGSFSLYTLQGATMKKVTANVNCVVCDGVGYGSALIKKHGSMPVVVGDIEEDER